MTTFNNDSLKNELASEFIRRNDLIARWGMTIGSFLTIPGLVGFWPMSSVQRSTGNVYDLSGQNRTLAYNGNPTFSVHNALTPYIDLDGTGDYLSKTDETDLDVIGNETIFPSGSMGLTFGGWFWHDSIASTYGLMSKWTAPGNLRASLLCTISGVPTVLFSTDGTNTVTAAHSLISTGAWYFMVARFVPGSFCSVYVNGTGAHTAIAITTLFNSSAPLVIGGFDAGGSGLLDGRASLCFMSACALQESLIISLFHQSRILFGV